MTQIVDFGRPKLNGIAPGLVAGQLLGASQLSELFLRRVSPALVSGKAELDEIRGKSIVWNQLINYLGTPIVSGDTTNVTVTKENGRIKIVVADTVSTLTDITFANNVTDGLKGGHKYATVLNASPELVPYLGYNEGQGVWWQYSGTGFWADDGISTILTTSDLYGRIYIGNTLPAGTYYIVPELFDLTLGNLTDIANINDFKALYPGYHAYNPGIIKNNDAVALVSESEDQEKQSTLRLGLNALRVPSHNIWDEEAEPGSIDAITGENTPSDARYRSTTYAPVVGGAEYYLRTNGHDIRLYFYTADGQFISSPNGGTTARTFTTPEDCGRVRFVVFDETAYYGDICINLSDAAFNGLYEPYGEDGVRTVEGLDGVGAAYDSAKGYKLIKRMWEVDLGALTAGQWTKQSTGNFVTSALSSLAKGAPNNTTKGNLISNKLTCSVWNTAGTNNEIAIAESSVLFVGIAGVDSTDDLVTALQGVKLRFELATPIEYDIIGGLPGKVFDAFAGGSEFIVSPEDAETPSAPFIGEFSYPESAVRGIITEEVFKEFLDALGTAMGGTWTMTYDASTKTYSFSFTS